jgi:hypothetical protein
MRSSTLVRHFASCQEVFDFVPFRQCSKILLCLFTLPRIKDGIRQAAQRQ